MREIKFRAWDKKLKTMWANVQNAYDTIHHHAEDNSKGIDDCIYADCFQDVLDNSNYVVMQYTGLKDKNGREIYEGDIVLWNESPGIVEYHEDRFHCRWIRSKGGSGMSGYSRHIEVIGNIYETPELLK